MAENLRRVAFCPHCGNTAPQRLLYSHSYETDWYGPDGRLDPEMTPQSEALLFVCETCGEALLYAGVARSESNAWPELAYPEGVTLPDSVPEPIRDVYAEAARIKRLAPLGFTILIRKALEAICDDRKIPAGVLNARLKKLVER